MSEKKIMFNLGLIFTTLLTVLVFRMETAKVSYEVSQKYDLLQSLKSHSQVLATDFKNKTGFESLVDQGAAALTAMKTKQVVMVNTKGTLFSR